MEPPAGRSRAVECLLSSSVVMIKPLACAALCLSIVSAACRTDGGIVSCSGAICFEETGSSTFRHGAGAISFAGACDLSNVPGPSADLQTLAHPSLIV